MTKKLDITKCLIIRWTDGQIVVYAHYIQRTKLFYTHKHSLLNQTLAWLLWALFSKGPQPWLIICRLVQTLTYFLTTQDPTPRVTPVTLSPCWENSRHLWFVQPTLKSLASVSQWVNPRGFTWTNTFPTLIFYFSDFIHLWCYSLIVSLICPLWGAWDGGNIGQVVRWDPWVNTCHLPFQDKRARWVPAPRALAALVAQTCQWAWRPGLPREMSPLWFLWLSPCHKRVGSHGWSRVFLCPRATLVLHPAHFRNLKLSYPANLHLYHFLCFTA